MPDRPRHHVSDPSHSRARFRTAYGSLAVSAREFSHDLSTSQVPRRGGPGRRPLSRASVRLDASSARARQYWPCLSISARKPASPTPSGSGRSKAINARSPPSNPMVPSGDGGPPPALRRSHSRNVFHVTPTRRHSRSNAASSGSLWRSFMRVCLNALWLSRAPIRAHKPLVESSLHEGRGQSVRTCVPPSTGRYGAFRDSPWSNHRAICDAATRRCESHRLTVSALSRSAPSVAPPNPPPHQTRGCQHNEKTGQPGTCGAVSSEYRGDRELNKRVKQKNRVAEDLSPICESRRKGEANPEQAKANRGDNDNDRSN